MKGIFKKLNFVCIVLSVATFNLKFGICNCFSQNPLLWTQTNNSAPGSDRAFAITVYAGEIYIAGHDNVPGNDQWHIEKRDIITGALVAAFGTGGVVTVNPSAGSDIAYGIAANASGIYVVGRDVSPGNDQWRIEKRDLTTGMLVPAFGTGGIITSNPGIGNEQAYGITADANGIYVAGRDASLGNDQWRIEKRDLTTGTLVATFGTAGVVTDNLSAGSDIARTITIDGSGIYVGGNDNNPGNTQWSIQKRDLVTGALIWAQTNNPSAGFDFIFSITADVSGIYAAGYDFSSGNYQWHIEKRDLTTGTLVAAFGTAGVVTSDPSAGSDISNAITCDASGVYIAGDDFSQGDNQWRMEKRDLTTGSLLCLQTNNPSTGVDIIFGIAVDAGGIYEVGWDGSPGNDQWRVEKYGLYCSAVLTTSVISQNVLCNGVCIGTATIIPTGGSSPYYYNWSTGQTGETVTGLCAGTYTVIITDDVGATTTSTVTIMEPLALSVAITSTTLICNGNNNNITTVINATGGTSLYAYLWNNGVTMSVVSNVQVGNYSVTVTDANGCTITLQAIIDQPVIFIADAGSDQTICEGENVALNASGGSFYTWNNGVNSPDIIVSPTITTIYSVTVSNGNCSDDDTVRVIVSVNPSAYAGNNITIMAGQSVTLSASGTGIYLWSTGETTTTITHQPSVTTVYYLTIMDAASCISMDSVIVTVDIICKEIYVPTAFSPNDDGQNDFLKIEGNCIKKIYFAIYSRWGEKVFSAEGEPASGGETLTWDGKYKGKLMDTGVFAYLLSATLVTSETITKKGNISLIR